MLLQHPKVDDATATEIATTAQELELIDFAALINRSPFKSPKDERPAADGKKAAGGKDPNYKTNKLQEQHTFKLQNVYPGGSQEFVSFTAADKQIRANYDSAGAMPIQFHPVAGKPGVFLMQNRYVGDQDGGAIGQWISFTADGEWLYAKYSKDDAMPVMLEPLGDMTFNLLNQSPGQEGNYVSFTSDGMWLRANYSQADAMPLKAIPVQADSFRCDETGCALCP